MCVGISDSFNTWDKIWAGWRAELNFRSQLCGTVHYSEKSQPDHQRLNASCKSFSVIVQAACFWTVTFSLASTSSDELEPIISFKHEGWKRREVKGSGTGY